MALVAPLKKRNLVRLPMLTGFCFFVLCLRYFFLAWKSCQQIRRLVSLWVHPSGVNVPSQSLTPSVWMTCGFFVSPTRLAKFIVSIIKGSTRPAPQLDDYSSRGGACFIILRTMQQFLSHDWKLLRDHRYCYEQRAFAGSWNKSVAGPTWR